MTDYAPNFASEKLLAGPPYLGCRISSDWIATDIATRGESSRRDDGRLKLKRARTKDLQRGWRAFATQQPADSNGTPDQGDVRLIHGAMFPDLPDPILIGTRDWSEVWEMVGEYAVSLALRLRDVRPGSPLRKYTSADHQMVLYERGGGKAHVLDPMHAHSLTYQGVWAEQEDFRAGARGIANGLIVAEAYPAGEWTAEALMRKRKNRRIRAALENLSRQNTSADGNS